MVMWTIAMCFQLCFISFQTYSEKLHQNPFMRHFPNIANKQTDHSKQVHNLLHWRRYWRVQACLFCTKKMQGDVLNLTPYRAALVHNTLAQYSQKAGINIQKWCDQLFDYSASVSVKVLKVHTSISNGPRCLMIPSQCTCIFSIHKF